MCDNLTDSAGREALRPITSYKASRLTDSLTKTKDSQDSLPPKHDLYSVRVTMVYHKKQRNNAELKATGYDGNSLVYSNTR